MILLLLNEVRSQTELKECAAGVLLGPCHSLYYASVMKGNWMFSVQTLTSSREDEPRDNRHCYAVHWAFKLIRKILAIEREIRRPYRAQTSGGDTMTSR